MSSSQMLWTSNDVRPVARFDPDSKQTCLCFFPQCTAINSRMTSHCHRCGHSLLLLGRYRAISEISQGRYAKTYDAIDEIDQQRCVIKQFSPQKKGDSLARLDLAQALFQQEALILQRLGNHPQIPNLIAFFEQNKTQFLVQEFISGQSLYQDVKQSPQTETRDIQAILLDLLPVLDFIHSHDIIHRDIKLGNIIQSNSGSLWLIDFGAAYHKNLGRFGITGTPGYAAPEQLQGQFLPASDLYSLAVTCVSLLTGNILDTSESEFHSPSEFLQSLWTHSGRSIQPQLAQVLERMLQHDLNLRYQSAADVLNDLKSSISLGSSVDYGRLQWLLAEEKYQEADQETWQLLLQLSDRQPHEMLTVDAIDRVPFTDLRILDQLWCTASEGRFGFGMQLRLYQRQGNIRDFSYERWQSFGEQVGWCSEGTWLGYRTLGFSPDSPPGHLPAVFPSWDNRQGQPCGPLGWWRLGFISLMERFSLS